MFLDFGRSHPDSLASPTKGEAEQELVLSYLSHTERGSLVLSDFETPSYYGRWETPRKFLVWSKSRPSLAPCLVILEHQGSHTYSVTADELWDACPFDVESLYETVRRVHRWSLERWRKL